MASLPRLRIASLALCMGAALSALSCAGEQLEEPSFVLDAAPVRDPGLPTFDANARPVQDPFAGSCAAQTIRPERTQLDIFFMIDASGSMLDVTGAGVSKWAAVRSALASFARSPDSAGVSAAMHFFPLRQPGVPATCENDSACAGFGPCVFARTCAGSASLMPCDSDAACGSNGPCAPLGECGVQKTYCGPVGGRCSDRGGDVCQALAGRCAGRDVCTVGAYASKGSELLALPGAADAIARLLDAQEPEGATPTGPALAGAIERARASAAATPGRKVAVVLATDGFPTTCEPRSVAEVARIAAAATGGSPSVSTFVVGVFAPDEASAAGANLAQIAQAGGTPKPFIVSTGANVSQDFLAVLNDVRATALACEYKVPEAQRGQIDLEQVNVRFLTANNENMTIGNVASAGACHPTKGGWYYEMDAATGARASIRVCPASCARLKAEPRGRVDLIVGCKTVPVD